MRQGSWLAASSVALAAGIVLFLLSCFSAASDAQGAILFLFTTPIITVSIVAGAAFAWRAEKQGARAGRGLWWGGTASFIFFVLFIVAALVPALRSFPESVIGAVAWGYERLSGESPYAATHRGLNVLELMRADLIAQRGKRIDLGRLNTRNRWDRVCIFGPGTDDAAALRVLQVKDWSVEKTSAINLSGDISLLVFVEGDVVVHQVEMPRREADFAASGMRCFARESAVFVREEDRGGAPAFYAEGG